MKILNYKETSLSSDKIRALVVKIGNLLPEPLNQRINLQEYCSKLLAHGEIHIAFDEKINEALGLIAFYANDSKKNFGYISLFGILPHAQYRGIGKALLVSCIAYCKINDLKRILLEVNESNCRAISIYKAQGFVISEKRKNKLLMTKEITL